MSDNRFTGAAAPGGGDRFGYFAAPPTSRANPFGGPPAPPAAAPAAGPGATAFGAPMAAPGPVAFGSPYAAAPPEPAPARPKARVRAVALTVLLLVVLGGAFQAYRVWKHNQPITMPATLAGLPRATDTRITSVTSQVGASLQQANPDLRTQTASYAAAGDLTKVLVVAVGRGHADISKDFAEANGQFGHPTGVGSSSCAASTDKSMTICERTSGDLTAIVLSIGSKGPQSPQAVSAAVDELWQSL